MDSSLWLGMTLVYHAERSEASIADVDSSLWLGMTSACHAERSEASMIGFLTAFGMTVSVFVMLNEAQRSEASIADVDSSLTLGMTSACHAERSEASMIGFLTAFGMTVSVFVMLNGA